MSNNDSLLTASATISVIHCPLSLTHAPPHEILSGCLQPYFESPERYHRILNALLDDASTYTEQRLELTAKQVTENEELREAVERVHEGEYLAFLREIYDEWTAEGGSKVCIISLHRSETAEADLFVRRMRFFQKPSFAMTCCSKRLYQITSSSQRSRE
jgi:acetoin utilization deacetylase AcuC-like enzyme